MSRRVLVPLVAGVLGLSGSLGTTLFLHHAARAALERVLEERLRGAGETTAGLLAGAEPTGEVLRAVMQANGLEGAYVVTPSLNIVADATGPAGVHANLLRVDAERVSRALAGNASVDFGYAVGKVRVAAAYFPVAGPDDVKTVLVLEAGQAFAAARASLRNALWIGIVLSVLGALALVIIAFQWARGEDQRRRAAELAARGDALARMAAMAAHEIRNPIGVIRGAVELMNERSGAALGERDREALGDVLGEVERLRRLTQDFLDLAREPTLMAVPTDLAEIASEAVRGLARTYPNVSVEVTMPPLPLDGDPVRLRQVLSNLLANAAEAGAHHVEVRGEAVDGQARLEVHDDGPGIAQDVRERLFEPFATGRAHGTGLGLSISRRIVERHGGALELASGEEATGAKFEIRLPLKGG